MCSWSRCLGGAVGFGFGVMWMSVGLGAAIVSLLLAGLGYGAVLAAERAQVSAATRRANGTPAAEESLELDGFELGRFDRHDAERPNAEMAALSTPVEYGWPSSG